MNVGNGNTNVAIKLTFFGVRFPPTTGCLPTKNYCSRSRAKGRRLSRTHSQQLMATLRGLSFLSLSHSHDNNRRTRALFYLFFHLNRCEPLKVVPAITMPSSARLLTWRWFDVLQDPCIEAIRTFLTNICIFGLLLVLKQSWYTDGSHISQVVWIMSFTEN